MYSKRRAFFAVFSFACLAACTDRSALPPARIAVLRFENLTPDRSLDWMGRAASEIIAHEIGGGASSVISSGVLDSHALARSRPISAPGESFERDAAIANGASRIIIGQYSLSQNRLVLDITERDVAEGKTIESFSLLTPDPTNLFGLADSAAHRLSPQVRPFDSKSNPAIAAWARGLEEPDPAKAADDYAVAVKADPEFAAAWLSWSSNLMATGNAAASQKVLAEAQQHAGSFSDLDRARLKLATARFSGDRAGLLAAANELARLKPDDPDTLRAVAEQNLAARQYLAAATAYRRLTTVQPNDALGWNQLGYALMYTGDYDGAMSALRSYEKRVPNDPNPLDSQGDVSFAFGRFTDAAKFYDQASGLNPLFENSSDMYKSALSTFMGGDLGAADKKFETFATARRSANDPSVPLRTAQWQFITGRHDQAFALLAGSVASAAPQLKAVVLTQMAIWDLQLGRRPRALQETNDALKTGAVSPATIIVRFACEDARTAADWSARADRILAPPQMAQLKPIALAYALYFSQFWEAAEPVWKQLVDRAGPDDTITPAVYAQILVELHRPQDAKPYVARFPIPQASVLQEFLPLVIPQILKTRAAAGLSSPHP